MPQDSNSRRKTLITHLYHLFSFEFTRRIHEGSPGTFETVYHAFRHPIRSWMQKKVNHPELTEELTQEVFLKAWKSRRLFHPAHELSHWIWAIARNLLIDRFRSRSELEAYPGDPLPLIENLKHSGLNPENALENRLRDHEIEKRLKTLSKEQQLALTLRLVEQKSYQEISDQLQLSLAAVKSTLHRAKEKILAAEEKNPRSIISHPS